ncbi:MAG: efflux RND transporter periplasmic adaptor subunit [Pseudolabrys sp.]
MSKRKALFGVAVLALIGIAVLARGYWSGERATAARAQHHRTPRVVLVEVAKAVRKLVPVRIDALGTVTPIASVAIKARIDTTIVGVHFADGAHVNKGDLLFTLDCRAVDAQIAQTQGNIARDKAQLAGAERDVKRYARLVAKNASPQVHLDNAKTQAQVYRASVKSDQGTLQNLTVQRSYCTITAPITGRISAANVKVGNFVRQADSTPMATINQMAPVYVSFSVAQKNLPAIRKALAAKSATIEAVVPGESTPASGRVSMIENTVDPSTGMATIRATMPNEDERLWPGTLVATELTLRREEAVVVPTKAVQVSQSGSFVFVVADDNTVKVRHVDPGRQVASETVIASGLKPGETVVTDGQLRLRNGSRVAPRGPRPAGGAKARAGT